MVVKDQKTDGRRKAYWMLLAVCAASLLIMGGYTVSKAPTTEGDATMKTSLMTFAPEDAAGDSLIAEAKAEEAAPDAPAPEAVEPEAVLAETAAEEMEPAAPVSEAVEPDPVIMEAEAAKVEPAAPAPETEGTEPIIAEAKAEEAEASPETPPVGDMAASQMEPTTAASLLTQQLPQGMAGAELVTESEPLVIEEAEKATATPGQWVATPTPGPLEEGAVVTSGSGEATDKTPEPVATAAPGTPAPTAAEGAPAPTAAEGAPTPAPTPTNAPASLETPSVEIEYYYDALKPGKTIRMVALTSQIPEGYEVHYQWKNDANGELEPIPGATEAEYEFELDAENVKWGWVVELTLVPAT